MSQMRLAVFDVDGTLIDSEHNIVSAMTDAWARMELGIPDPGEVRRIIGLSLVEACAALLPWGTHELHRAVAEAYKDAFRALRLLPAMVEPLFPGVRDVLDRLEKDGWMLGLATGKSRRGVDSMMSNHALHGRFVTIQTADDNPGKPHPAMLVRAAAECGLPISQVVMVGDTAFDMMMARSAGAMGIGVSWGYHTIDELKGAGAAYIIDNFDDLPDLIQAVGQPDDAGDRECV